MTKGLKRFFEQLGKAAGLASGLIIIVVGCILFAEVVLRYSGHPTQWIPEWSVYLFGWATLGGAAYTLQQGKHVRVELLMMHLSPVRQNVLDIGTSLVGAGFCALVALHGWEHLADVLNTGETTSTALRVPLWMTDFPLFVGFVLLTLQFLILAADRVLTISLLKRFGACPEGLSSGAPGHSGTGAAAPDRKGRGENGTGES